MSSSKDTSEDKDAKKRKGKPGAKGNRTINDDDRGAVEKARWHRHGSLIVKGVLALNCDLCVPGTVEAEMGIQLAGNLHATGAVRCGGIGGKGDVRAGGLFSVGGIDIDGDVYVLGDIVANSGAIQATGNIVATGRIATPAGLHARSVSSLVHDVRCKYLETRELPMGPAFYAGVPPTAGKFATLMALPARDTLSEQWREDAATLCAWDGWHALIRAQLRMYFGLSEREDLAAVGGAS